MRWVIQTNLYSEAGYEKLLEALSRREIPYTLVKFIPFTHRLIDPNTNLTLFEDESQIPEVQLDASENIMACGSTLLAKVAQERGWKPGSFWNENFDYAKFVEHWGENLLNFHCILAPLGEIQPHWVGDMFVRPAGDGKAFSGMTCHTSEFDYWRKDLLSQGRDLAWLSPETPTVIAPVAEINAEYRFFVVEGRIITGSMYKLGRTVITDEFYPPYIREFAEAMIKMWEPARAFVIDIAETPDGPKVIEINNFNQSGFYACDMGKIVEAVEMMEF